MSLHGSRGAGAPLHASSRHGDRARVRPDRRTMGALDDRPAGQRRLDSRRALRHDPRERRSAAATDLGRPCGAEPRARHVGGKLVADAAGIRRGCPRGRQDRGRRAADLRLSLSRRQLGRGRSRRHGVCLRRSRGGRGDRLCELERRRSGGNGRGGGDRPNREERQRIDVALVVTRDAHAEIHERLGEIDLAARADRADR
jgi:hypothetical protein